MATGVSRVILISTTLLNFLYRVDSDNGTAPPPPEADAGGKETSTSPDELGLYPGNIVSTKNVYRLLVVLLTVTAITLLFFLAKFCSGRKNRKTKKYGVLATSGTDVELRPLDDDEEEDEDVTVFDANR